MGRKRKITKLYENPVVTDRTNPLCNALIVQYPKESDVIIERFESYTGLPFDGSSISSANLVKFRDGCKLDIAPNYVALVCSQVSCVLKMYSSDERIPSHVINKYCSILSCKQEDGVFGIVTEEDIEPLVDYYPFCDDKIDKAVIASALLEFYTGARSSDIQHFTIENIRNSAYINAATQALTEIEMLCYTSIKTGIRAQIPVKPIVKDILADKEVKGIKVPTSTFDVRIKKLFTDLHITRLVSEKRAGKKETMRPLNECVSSHTFRRSFATNLDRKGISIETTSRMMGHKNTQQTRRYVQGGINVLSDDVLAYFQ